MPTLITRYVNVNSPAGGNGTTSATGSGDPNRAYPGYLAALTAESSSRTNLVSRDEILKLDCAGGVDFAVDPDLPNFTTDATRYVWIYSAPENSHRGIWDTSKYLITYQFGRSLIINITNIKDLKFEGIQIENRSTNGVWSVITHGDATTQDRSLEIHRCFLRSISGSGNKGAAINLPYVLRKTLRVTNTIIQGKFDTAIAADYIQSGLPPTVIYNNTLYDCDGGMNFQFSAADSAVHIKNNIVSGSAITACYRTGSNTTSSNNISSDNSSFDVQFRNMVPSFINTTSSSLNLQLSNNDTIAKDKGATLVNDSIYPFSTDIANNPRPQRFSSWDIGAFENPNGKNKILINNVNSTTLFTISQTQVGKFIEGSQ